MNLVKLFKQQFYCMVFVQHCCIGSCASPISLHFNTYYKLYLSIYIYKRLTHLFIDFTLKKAIKIIEHFTSDLFFFLECIIRSYSRLSFFFIAIIAKFFSSLLSSSPGVPGTDTKKVETTNTLFTRFYLAFSNANLHLLRNRSANLVPRPFRFSYFFFGFMQSYWPNKPRHTINPWMTLTRIGGVKGVKCWFGTDWYLKPKKTWKEF